MAGVGTQPDCLAVDRLKSVKLFRLANQLDWPSFYLLARIGIMAKQLELKWNENEPNEKRPPRKNRPRAKVSNANKYGKRLYNIWKCMNQRCTNKNTPNFKDYGARGIFVCEDWKKSYEIFSNWAIEHQYDDLLSLDRIDNDGNYCPENCKWSNRREQNRNKSSNIHITAFGETKILIEWSEDLRCKSTCAQIVYRIRNNWCPEDAISTPAWGKSPRQTEFRRILCENSHVLLESEILLETWKPVAGFPAYEVSDLGRIRSFFKKTGSSRSKKYPLRYVVGDTPKILAERTNKSGRSFVSFYSGDGKHVTQYVARVVLANHLCLPEPGMQACHFPDPNPRNCRLSNLRWDTLSENQKDRGRLKALMSDGFS